jgi:hypothetical protein
MRKSNKALTPGLHRRMVKTVAHTLMNNEQDDRANAYLEGAKHGQT